MSERGDALLLVKMPGSRSLGNTSRVTAAGGNMPVKTLHIPDGRVNPTKRRDIVGPIAGARGKRADSIW